VKRIVLPRKIRTRPTLTVVIPCYNYGHFLQAAVASVLDQPGVDARVIIVDDASPDGSGEVARELARMDSRVRAVIHETNSRHIQTYNDGLALVDTDYVTLVSADDIVAKGALGRAVALMETHPSVGLVYGSIAIFARDDDPRPTRARWYHLWRIWSGDEWVGAVAASGYNFLASPEAVVRTAAMREVGYYNRELPHSGDLEYWLRIAARWDVGQIYGPIQAYYRVHGGNMHTSDFGTREADLKERFAAFRVLGDPSVANELPRAAEHLDTARRTLLGQADALLEEESAAGADVSTLRLFRAQLASPPPLSTDRTIPSES